MRLIVRETQDQAAQYIADYIISKTSLEYLQSYNIILKLTATERINGFSPTAERPFVLGLPTGSSPLPIYKALIQAYNQGKISFRHVVTFNMDEYVGLPREHPESYHSFMFSNFFSHVDIDSKNVNILNGNAPNLREECLSYEAKIKALGGIELFLGGVGSDGHIAFNEPGSSLASRTRIKSLAYETIVANARFFNNDLSLVPRMALTVGVQTIMDAKEVVIIASGTSKALAIQQAIEGGVGHLCTLSCLQLHPCSMVVVDEDATMELKVKTVKVCISQVLSERSSSKA
ncbi:glucosamine-6-phosphate isomerase, putative [Talaromyces stipitatus ATCC 10500]|uniref:Glucosamine-6-phosphate isomerase n=1 Tax=Talaromyces stipitatus (strain ATCC 10500 / CBS 375.48 / QM 6759 / NRRL 1006) TaxID=441959 RepID=B8M0S6_TALSN|nr:glucosamine-6-phosphate isomerase, putative [Talaromyces stipitatus ATCC 10500]EED21459.1 glucosamine-6-phosphate isomerase, putative [Talaromyces stipitatus ATCC 10500]